MTTTLGQLTQQVSSLLHSFAGYHEQVTWLTQELTDSATSAVVNDATQVRIGVAEIEDELVYVVSSPDEATLTIAPFGRGYQGSVAAAHSVNAPVIGSPLVPRVEIQLAIRETLAQTYPTLYQVKSTTFTFTPTQMTYELPEDVDEILTVEWELTGPTNLWHPILEWDLVEKSQEATGKAITLREAAEAGRSVQVVYTATFGELADSDATLESVGFPSTGIDVLRYGAAQRLIRGMDLARLQMRTVENASRAQYVAPGDANKVANNYFALYQQRLFEERTRLQHQYPARPHYER